MIAPARWILAETPEPLALCGSACISRLLQGRGLTTAEAATEFLRPPLKRLQRSVSAPADARGGGADACAPSRDRERIVLYGDYDVDGVTSLALLHEMLAAYGADPALFLPSRIEEGYGLSREGVERCWQTHQPQLLIAVDCGTSSAAEIADLVRRGVDVIVLDHHEPKAERPDCIALVNPKARAMASSAISAASESFSSFATRC